jgi:hypothetical protein
LLHIPFSDFLNPESVKQTSVEARGQTFHVPAYNIQSEIIWGATAMMIAELVAAYRS